MAIRDSSCVTASAWSRTVVRGLLIVIGIAGVGVVVADAGAATPLYSAPVIDTDMRQLYDVEAADLNGDGAPDLVTAEWRTVSVMLVGATEASAGGLPTAAVGAVRTRSMLLSAT